MTEAKTQIAPSSSSFSTARQSPAVLDYLRTRRSCSLKIMAGPGPNEAQIRDILGIAARIPDHGRLCPWYFIVLTGDNRAKAGALLEAAWRAREPDASPAKLELERARFLRAPVVIGVVSRMRPGKVPLWEQILSAGALCHNLCLAANAMGFGTTWLTEWFATDAAVKAAFGLDEADHFAGFLYIGTPTATPEERARPDFASLTTFWTPGAPLQKGDNDGAAAANYPPAGFDLGPLHTKKPATSE